MGLAMVACLVWLAACGGGTDELDTADVEPTATSEPPTVGPEPTAAPTAVSGAPTSTAAPIEESTPTPLPIEEQPPTPAPTTTVPIGSARTITVTFAGDSYGFASTFDYAQAIDGSFRLDTSPTDIVTYDARTGRQSSFFVFDDGEESVFTDVGYGAGPPDFYGANFAVQREAALHAMALEGTAGTATGAFLGRPTIVFEALLTPNAIGGGPDFIRTEIDAETGVTLRFEGTEAGVPVITLEALEVATFDDRLDIFSLDPGLDDGIVDFDAGFVPAATLDEASTLVGYPIPRPQVVPDGYEIDLITVAPGRTDGFTGPEASNPPNVDVASIRYRNGWRSFTITARRVGPPDPFGWVDPFGGEGQSFVSRSFTVESGLLAGASAELSVAPETIPHTWVLGEDLVFTVAGSLTDLQMIDIVESLAES